MSSRLEVGDRVIIEWGTWGTWGRDERELLRSEAATLGASTELAYLDVTNNRTAARKFEAVTTEHHQQSDHGAKVDGGLTRRVS